MLKPENYKKYRGKCYEMVMELCEKDPTLKPVRGYYMCWLWGKQPHWWAVKPDGTIVDPTIKQFPEPHIGEYIPFDGIVECSNCGKKLKEDDALLHINYTFCSSKCFCAFVGIGG